MGIWMLALFHFGALQKINILQDGSGNLMAVSPCLNERPALRLVAAQSQI
jgi:hypothetical protein